MVDFDVQQSNQVIRIVWIVIILFVILLIVNKYNKVIEGDYEQPEYSDSAMDNNNRCWRIATSRYPQDVLEGGIHYCDKALEEEPAFLAAMNSKGFLLMRVGKYDKAREVLEQAVAKDSAEAEKNLKLLDSCMRKGCDSEDILDAELKTRR